MGPEHPNFQAFVLVLNYISIEEVKAAVSVNTCPNQYIKTKCETRFCCATGVACVAAVPSTAVQKNGLMYFAK
jgi:hypothetical protein